MINRLTIDFFRGIRHLDVQGMERICLFSGKNNIGKSTLLEALFLYMDHATQDVFNKLDYFRTNIYKNQLRPWEPVFYNMDVENGLTISLEQEGKESKLIYRKDTDYLPRDNGTIPDDVLAQFRSATKESYSLRFNYAEVDYKESGHLYASAEGALRQMKTNLPENEIRPMKSTQYVNMTISRIAETVLDGVGDLEIAGEKERIVNILRELDPTIEDIVTISKQGIPQLRIRINGNWLPLQCAGDGVMKLLLICLSMFERENGLLLIDEIETGFHYSMYGKLWRIIDEISKETNCQVIATTHSYEMIAGTKDNISNTDDFAYYRLGKSKEELKAFRYDYSLLDSALSAEMEVR